MYFIGIDIGTTSVKIIAIDKDGNVIKSVTKDYPIFFPKPLWSEQNPEDWWGKTIEGLEDILDHMDKEEVKAISFSGQMHGLVTLDKDDNVVRPAILWNDQRTQKECEYLNNIIGRENISKWTANLALTGFTAPKVLWVKENEPENFARIEKIMLPKDYISYKMSGIFATDMSDASGTLYLDVQNRKWSSEMLEILGITENQLPKLFESYESVGNISPHIAERLGLSEDVKIVIGGGDQAVGAVGGAVVNPGECSVSLGTSGVVFTATDKFFVDENNSLHSFCHANGKYHLMGVTLTAAASLKWWIENVNKCADYDEILSEAASAPIDDELFFLPYLMGERTPHNDPDCRALFIGLNITHSRMNMTRAVLEGVAFSLRDTLQIMKSMGIELSAVSISGGGSKSDLWCSIIADVLNIRVNKLNSDEGPGYGAAILASVGYGAFKTVEEACDKFITITRSLYPDSKNAQLYEQKYQKYAKIYPATKELFTQIIK